MMSQNCDMNSFIENLNEVMRNGYKDDHGRITSDYNQEQEALQSYHGREILELLQNADDEMIDPLPKEVRLSFDKETLIIANFGNEFTKEGVESLRLAHLSPKRKAHGFYIGNKGTGFRSILGWADEVIIHSGELHIRFSEKYSQSIVDEILAETGSKEHREAATLVFPEVLYKDIPAFDITTTIIIKVKKKQDVADDVINQLKSLDQNILLFLNHTEKLTIDLPGHHAEYTKERKSTKSDKVILRRVIDGKLYSEYEWRLFQREGTVIDTDGEMRKYSVVLAYRKQPELSYIEKKVYSFFKTDVVFPYPFLLHGTFHLNPDRNHLIKNSAVNHAILENAADLMVQAAKETTSARKADYSIVKKLIADVPSTWRLDENYDFISMVQDSARDYAILPNANGQYISFEDADPVFYNTPLTKYLSGPEFDDYLQYTDDYEIESFLEGLGSLIQYRYNVASDHIKAWLNKKSEEINQTNLEEVLSCVAETSLYFLAEYKNDLRNDKNYPHFFFNQEGEWIKNGESFYYDSDIEITQPPAFAHVQVVHPIIFAAIRKCLENSNLKYSVDYNDLELLGLKAFELSKVTDSINEVLREAFRVSEQSGKDKFGKAIRWIYRNRTVVEKYGCRILVPTKAGGLQYSDSLYLGEEYGNTVVEHLFAQKPEWLATDISSYMDSRITVNVSEFVEILGLSFFPRRKVENFQIGHSSNKVEQGYVKGLLSLLKYPYMTHTRTSAPTEYSSAEEFYLSVKRVTGDRSNIDHLDYILRNCSTKAILEWLDADKDLQNALFHADTESVDSHLAFVDLGHSADRSIPEIKRAPSYIRYLFKTIPWVEIDGNRHLLEDCLLELDSDVKLEPYLFNLDVDFYIDPGKGKKRLQEKYRNYFMELGVKRGMGENGFASLPAAKIYTVLNALPELEGSESVSKTLYTAVIDKSAFKKNDLKSIKAYETFISKGKVLTNKGYKRINSVFYRADSRMAGSALKNINVLALGIRKNARRVEDLLGVKRLKVSAKLASNPIKHKDDLSFWDEWRKFIPMAYALRALDLNTESERRMEAAKMHSISIKLCSYLEVTYNGKTPETLLDYEFVIPDNRHIYLKAPENLNYKNDTHFAAAIADALCACLEIPSRTNDYADLLETDDKDRLFKLRRLTDVDEDCLRRSITEFRAALGEKERFLDVIADITGESEKRLLPFADKLDFENWTTDDNLKSIISVFKDLRIDTEQFNDYDPQQAVDLRPFYRKRVEAAKEKYKSSYKEYWFKKLKTSSLEEKMLLVEHFRGFDDLVIEPANSVEFDPDLAVYNAVGIKPKKKTIELNRVYADNLKKWETILTESNQDRDESFLNSDENTSLMYFGEFDELLRRYFEAQKRNDSNSVDDDKDYDFPVDSVEILTEYEIKPMEHLAIPQKERNRSLGYTERTESRASQVRNGKRGEKLVYDNLRGRGLNVTWVSENAKILGVNPEGSADYGYDMRLVDDDGSVTYIEVKTSSKSWDEGLLLFLSDREHQFALDHADRYLVYYVSGIKKGKDAKIIVLSDLFKNGELNKENYSIRCERNYIISAEPE